MRARHQRVARTFCAATAATALAASLASAQGGPTQLPPRLDSYLSTTVHLTGGERMRLLRGNPISKLLDADARKEVAVFGAVWINAPMRRYVEAVRDVEQFERGAGFLITKRISMPPRLDDFAQMRLSDQDLQDLRTCRVGDCELKLSQQALQTIRREVDWNTPTARVSAEAVMRRLAVEYVTGYLEGGNERLAVYRDSSRPTFVAAEFRGLLDQMPSLTADMPDLRRYLLGFPNAPLPNATSFLYWQETDFGLKPTVRISHVTIREGAGDTVVASKMLYASHYFWTALELRILLPDPSRGPSFWLVTVNRSRSDGLDGFTGMFVRRRVRSEVQRGTLTSLTVTKNKLEQLR